MNSNSGNGRGRRAKNTYVSKSGHSIKLNSSLTDRIKAKKASRAAEKATYLSTLSKNRWRRILSRMHPKRVAQYWFSREGGIMALKIIGVAIVASFFMTIGLFAYFRKDLPNIKDISGGNLGGSVNYYDSTGQVLLFQDYRDIKRVGVQSDQISPYMKDATVAIEDKGFYKEGAFDVRGIMRAAFKDAIKGGGAVQGGSTITQQLVKLNENWTQNRTITRKVKELILSVELEREYNKNQILTAYLNIAPYGGIDYGVEAAAQDYFHTSAKKLTLAQASMLAAMPQSPTYYSPYGSTQFNPEAGNTFSKEALIGRQQYILAQMAKQGYITEAQARDTDKIDVLAQVQPLVSNKYQNIKAPYFVLAAKDELKKTYGDSTVNRGGWKVITTLNMAAQAQAEKVVADNARNAAYAGADEEATVAENVPTGQIVALVGGTDFNDIHHGQNNYAATVKIPPGSSFKPYDYATLINNNNNVGAGSVLYDTQSVLPGYICTNHNKASQGGNCLNDYDNQQPGPITLRYALGGSRNIPAVKAMLESVPGASSPGSNVTQGDIKSINTTISTASALMDNTYDQQHHLKPYNCYGDANLTVIAPCYASSAIGDGAYLNLDDHVNGIASLAREGMAIPRTFIMSITDNSGKNIYQWKQPTGTQVIKQDAAYIVDNMASDPNASYLPGNCGPTTCYTSFAGQKFHRYNGWNFAVKTGTTNDNFDGLMASWSTQYAVVSWVGNHNRTVALKTTGMELLTEPLTRGMMQFLHQNTKPVNWTQPSDIKTLPAFVVRNHIHYGDVEPSPTNDLYPSWYVGGNSHKSTSQTIDKVSNMIATSCTPAGAKETIYNGNANSWNIDIFNKGKPNIGTESTSNTSVGPAATDNVHNCNDSPPTITLTAPSNCQTSCTITATVSQGTHQLSDPQYPQYPGTVTFTLNGQEIHKSFVTDSPSTVSFAYSPSSSGSGTVTATVTDSVLYSATSNQPMTYTSSQSENLNLNVNNHSASGASFSWTPISGANNYTLCYNGPTSGCQTVANTSANVGPLPNGSYSATVSANGVTSNTVTFTSP